MSRTESNIARAHYQYLTGGNVPMSGVRSAATFATLATLPKNKTLP
jgi:hypothetical protein